MSQDEALAFYTSSFTANAYCVWDVSGHGDFMLSFPQSEGLHLSSLPLQLFARMWVSGVASISPLHLLLAAKPVILINRRLDFCGETLRLVSQGAARR